MRRTIRLSAGIFLLSAVFLFASCGNGPDSKSVVVNGAEIPQLRPADTALGKPEERLTIRSTYNDAVEALRKNSDDPAPYLKLAEAYIMQSRISGNSAYYQAAVLKVLDHLIGSETSSSDQRFIAYMYKSNMLFGMNRFREALDAAQEGLKLGDGNAGIWATLSDAQVELGDYEAARAATDRMMELRPDLRSYARVSYLRELRGNMPGAIETMAMAMESGVPGLEPTEWARVQLGDLCMNSGKADSAKILYDAALEFRPGYAPAQVGLARLAMLRKAYPEAQHLMEAALKTNEDPLYLAQLADICNLSGNGQAAADAVQKALTALKSEEGEIPARMNPKPNYAREYAIIYRAARNYPKGLEFAQEDYKLRPENLQANLLLAWLLHLNGRSSAAIPHLRKSLATGWKSPDILMQASLICRAAGDVPQADAYRAQALAISPLIDPVILAETPVR